MNDSLQMHDKLADAGRRMLHNKVYCLPQIINCCGCKDIKYIIYFIRCLTVQTTGYC
jgi:hypothetical protein